MGEVIDIERWRLSAAQRNDHPIDGDHLLDDETSGPPEFDDAA